MLGMYVGKAKIVTKNKLVRLIYALGHNFIMRSCVIYDGAITNYS